MGETRPRWAGLPPAERERRAAQSAADRARAQGAGGSPLLLSEAERRRRQSHSATAQARAQRWSGLPEAERRRRQSQSDAARAAAARRGGPERGAGADVVALQHNETLQAMWNTIEHGGCDFMAKDDW